MDLKTFKAIWQRCEGMPGAEREKRVKAELTEYNARKKAATCANR